MPVDSVHFNTSQSDQATTCPEHEMWKRQPYCEDVTCCATPKTEHEAPVDVGTAGHAKGHEIHCGGITDCAVNAELTTRHRWST